MKPLRIARQREWWEDDNAHQALQQWVYMWRQANPTAPLPGLDFTIHVGREAVDLADGLDRIALLRMFAAAGADGQCLCGRDVSGRPLGQALGAVGETG